MQITWTLTVISEQVETFEIHAESEGDALGKYYMGDYDSLDTDLEILDIEIVPLETK